MKTTVETLKKIIDTATINGESEYVLLKFSKDKVMATSMNSSHTVMAYTEAKPDQFEEYREIGELIISKSQISNLFSVYKNSDKIEISSNGDKLITKSETAEYKMALTSPETVPKLQPPSDEGGRLKLKNVEEKNVYETNINVPLLNTEITRIIPNPLTIAQTINDVDEYKKVLVINNRLLSTEDDKAVLVSTSYLSKVLKSLMPGATSILSLSGQDKPVQIYQQTDQLRTLYVIAPLVE